MGNTVANDNKYPYDYNTPRVYINCLLRFDGSEGFSEISVIISRVYNFKTQFQVIYIIGSEHIKRLYQFMVKARIQLWRLWYMLFISCTMHHVIVAIH